MGAASAALQWADVFVDEGPGEFDKLKQVRRQMVKPVSLQLGSHAVAVQQKLGQGAFASVYQVLSLGFATAVLPHGGQHCHCFATMT